MPVTDSGKRTECIKVCFTEREIIDLNRLAVREDRKLADMAYVLVRRGMYGMVDRGGNQEEVPNGD